MLIVIHGDDIVASRKKLAEYMHGANGIFDQKSSADQIYDAASTQELFSEKKKIVIEQFLPHTRSKTFIEFVQKQNKDSNSTLVLWEDSLLSAPVLKKLSAQNVFTFQLPKLFFTYLDGLIPGNGKNESMVLRKMYPTFSEVQIFYAMVKRIRLLMMMGSGDADLFEELRKMSPWQKKKIMDQVRKWKVKDLTAFYQNLFELEKGMKTSALALPLIDHIDILLVNALQ